MTHMMTTPDGSALSALCFGAMQFGGTADAAASEGMYRACRAAGINFFDTAWVYTQGESERFLGRFIAAEREQVFVASKVASEGGAGRANILSQVDDSRKRLGIDRIDAMYLHQFDRETPLEESFETLAELHQAGVIGHIGVSNYAAWQVMKSVAITARLGLTISLCQPMYNLVKRQVEVEILPMALDQNIAVVPYSPLGGGLLTGKYRGTAKEGRLNRDKMYNARYGVDWMHDAAAALADLADARGVSAATLAVAWVARNPGVTAPIISARSVEQLGPSLAAADFVMDDALYAEISALSPRPAPATDRLEEQ